MLAPFIYTTFRDPRDPDEDEEEDDDGDKEPEYLGRVDWYLVSAAITTWAVIGELLTLGVALAEMSDVQFKVSVLLVPAVIVLVSLVLTCLYVLRTTYATIRAQAHLVLDYTLALEAIRLGVDAMGGDRDAATRAALVEALSSRVSIRGWSPH